jgi:hypothetical protein
MMTTKTVVQRVKQGLGEEVFLMFFTTPSNGLKGKTPDEVLQGFLQNAIRELIKQRPIRKQFLLRIHPDGIVPLPPDFLSVESLSVKGRHLTPQDLKSLSAGGYVVDAANRVVRFAKGTSGTVELYCTCVPREEDVPADSRLALVLHVKAQCCEYVAEKLRKNASLRIVGKNGVPYDPNNWEREAQHLRDKFYEMSRLTQ